MQNEFIDICNCPECHYFDMNTAHCCGLPEQINEQDISYIREAARFCHCVNPRLWEFYESLEVER